MKYVSTLGIALLSLAGTAFADVKLSENSRALAQIVLPDKPAVVEKTAARELKEHLDAMTGGDFKIVAFSEHDNSAASISSATVPRRAKFGACPTSENLATTQSL